MITIHQKSNVHNETEHSRQVSYSQFIKLLYFFRIIELPIWGIPSTDYVYVRFSSKKPQPFCFQHTVTHKAYLYLPKIPEKAQPEVSPHQDELFTSLTFRSLRYIISWEEQRNEKTSEAWRAPVKWTTQQTSEKSTSKAEVTNWWETILLTIY